MIKLAITILALVTLALAEEDKEHNQEYKDPNPDPYSGYYYPYYNGYYPFNYYHPAPYYYYQPGYYGYYNYPVYTPYQHNNQGHYKGHFPGFVFGGKFEGTCRGARDGLYYVDDRSFAHCSNYIKSIQACADGSANPPYSKFKVGKYYGFSEFCSVNLLAQHKVPVYKAHKAEEVKQQAETAHY